MAGAGASVSISVKSIAAGAAASRLPRLMNALRRMRKSHALKCVPFSNVERLRYARKSVSWTRSSASARRRVSRNAADISGWASSVVMCSNSSGVSAARPREAAGSG